jgi:hypothetical protein
MPRIARPLTASRYLWGALAAFALGQLLDVATTVYALSIGDTERNPLAHAALSTTGPLIYVLKLTATAALVFLIYRSRARRWAAPLATAVACLACACAWANIVTLIHA